MAGNRRVTGFLPDGAVLLEGGDIMQAVVAPNGALGVRSKTDEDRVGALDQHVGPPVVEPAVAPRGHFDLSGLDQKV